MLDGIEERLDLRKMLHFIDTLGGRADAATSGSCRRTTDLLLSSLAARKRLGSGDLGLREGWPTGPLIGVERSSPLNIKYYSLQIFN